jgi:hypothetical protein
MSLAVARLAPGATGGQVELEWQGLRVSTSIEAMTGPRMEPDGVILRLDPAAWRERRRQLDVLGGPAAH